mgnify:CR=1 FL=1
MLSATNDNKVERNTADLTCNRGVGRAEQLLVRSHIHAKSILPERSSSQNLLQSAKQQNNRGDHADRAGVSPACEPFADS